MGPDAKQTATRFSRANAPCFENKDDRAFHVGLRHGRTARVVAYRARRSTVLLALIVG